MRLRSKLVLAQTPLVLAMVVNGLLGHVATRALGQSSHQILQDNYRSVLAAQRMKEYIERIDSGALFTVAGHRTDGLSQAATFATRFDEELMVQEHNITEPGEVDATNTLRALWNDYRSRFVAFEHTQAAALDRTYFASLLGRFAAVKDAADAILALNQDAMVRKSDAAQATAERYRTLLMLVAAGGCAAGLLASAALTAHLLRPVSVLGHAVRRVGSGDLAARARLHGQDEIAELARDFNAMAERLQSYRSSSLGELIEAQQAAQGAIDSLPDAVLILSESGAVQHANRAAQTLFNLGDAPANLQSLHAAGEVAAAIARAHQHVLLGRGPYQPRGLEEATRTAWPGQEDCHLLARAMPVYAAHGAITGTTVVLQDVTRLRRFDDLKNDLVATVAHEFRTPLTSLSLAVHLCVEQAAGPLTDKQADLLHAARQDCERLQNFVDELLDVSRLQAGGLILNQQPVACADLLRSAVAAQQHAAAARQVQLHTAVLVPQAHLDSERIQWVLGNLLGNAIRHTALGSSVYLRALPQPHGVRFEVEDQGAGVPDEYREMIFAKYAQVPGSAGGSAGLGLFIAREIVQAHGGHIGVERAASGGSVFWCSLPNINIQQG